MNPNQRRRLRELEEQVNSMARALSDLQAHQLHTAPYRCPYCQPVPFIPYHPWPAITSTWIATNVTPTECAGNDDRTDYTTYQMPQTTYYNRDMGTLVEA